MIRLSRRYEYAIILMIELSRQNDPQKYYPLKHVAANHPISPKYLDRIAYTLARGGLIEALHGLGGGYRLCKSPSSYTLLDIMRAVDNESTEDPLEDETLHSFLRVWDDAKTAFADELSDMTLDQLV